MVKISIQAAAAHEQVNPIDLLNDAIVMDENGIERLCQVTIITMVA